MVFNLFGPLPLNIYICPKFGLMNTSAFKFVPNTLTSFNVLCGSLSVVMAFDGRLQTAGLLILTAAIFDFLDGLSARLLKAYSPMGKELDSLADVISFGLAPTIIVYQLVRMRLAPDTTLLQAPFQIQLALVLPFLMTIFSALRLAKFNIDTRQTDSFIGVPTPANAMIWASAPFIMAYYPNTLMANLFQNPLFLLPLTVLMSLLLVAELPLFALKFKNIKWQNNKTRFIFLAISAVLLIVFKIAALPLIILVYVAASVVNNLVCKHPTT